MGEPASKRLVGCDQLRPCSLCQRHVDHVVNRMVIVSASQLPCAIQIALIVSDANWEAPEQTVGAVCSRTAPTPPANAGDERVRNLFEKQTWADDLGRSTSQAIKELDGRGGGRNSRRYPIDYDARVNDRHRSRVNAPFDRRGLGRSRTVPP